MSRAPTQFKKGNTLGGRKKGSLNKVTEFKELPSLIGEQYGVFIELLCTRGLSEKEVRSYAKKKEFSTYERALFKDFYASLDKGDGRALRSIHELILKNWKDEPDEDDNITDVVFRVVSYEIDETGYQTEESMIDDHKRELADLREKRKRWKAENEDASQDGVILN